jgi:hypothetical protein
MANWNFERFWDFAKPVVSRIAADAVRPALGMKEALAVRLRKLAIDGEKTLQGVAELPYQQSFQV